WSAAPGGGKKAQPGTLFVPVAHCIGNRENAPGESPMSNAALETAIEAAWEARDGITPATKGETRDAIEATLAALDSGSLRVAERGADGSWHVNQWAKKA